MAYIIMAYIVMADTVMAYIVMGNDASLYMSSTHARVSVLHRSR